MKISNYTGNVFKRLHVSDLDQQYLSSDTRVATKINTSLQHPILNVFKTSNMYIGKYTKLDSTIPAVAYVKLIVGDSNLFVTSSIPPKYIQSFNCKRVNNDVGTFTLDLIIPDNTFAENSDDDVIKLINLFGCIDSAVTGTQGEVDGYACAIEYGWRGSASDTVIRYNQAGIYGMTLNYTDGAYICSITGLLNQDPAETYAVSAKTISKVDLETAIDNSKLNEASYGALNILDTSSAAEFSGVKVKFSIGAQRYTQVAIDNTGRAPDAGISYAYYPVTGTDATTPVEFILDGTTWNEDFTYIKATTYWYSHTDAEFVEQTAGADTADTTDDTYNTVESFVNFTYVEPGQRISDKVELLAIYLYGKDYVIEVDHSDKEFTEHKTFAQIATDLNGTSKSNDGESGTDSAAVTVNETTTSWYTWLYHMVSLCINDTQATEYSKYAQYDKESDVIIDKLDLDNIYTYDSLNRNLDNWKLRGFTEDNFAEKLSEADFNTMTTTFMSEHKDDWFIEVPLTGYHAYGIDIEPFSGGMRNHMVNPAYGGPTLKTYDEYLKDYDTYTKAQAAKADKANLRELLDTYDGLLKRDSAIQFYIHFMDAVAGKPAKIYIGPEKTNTSTYTYVVNNNQPNSTVTSFELSENLVYLIAAAKSYMSVTNGGRYQIDPATGSTVKSSLSTESDQILSNEDYAAKVANAVISKISSGQVSAKLSVVSDITSRSLQVTDSVRVGIYRNGGQTLFTGTYTVIGVEDTIDSSGVLTTVISLLFTQSQSFEIIKNIILSHLNSAKVTEDTN